MTPLRALTAAAWLALSLVAPARAAERRPEVAPYVAVRFGPDLEAWSRATGVRRAVLAFYNSDGVGCQGAWPVDEATLLAQVSAFRAVGGEVILSSGGWNADDLAARCPDAASLAAAYQVVLDRFAAKRLDLDPESNELHDNLDPVLVDRRSAALKLLQDGYRARGKRLEISFTLAASPTRGIEPRSLYVLRSALAAGVEVAVVSPMVMNYHEGPSPLTMGARAIATLELAEAQLKALRPGLSDAAVWRGMGAVAMIGQNDPQGEVFTLDDARALAAYAKTRQLARLGFWAVSRDNGSCPGAFPPSLVCSGVAQGDWAFTGVFAGFAVPAR
jgi:hypothetical protein